MRDRPFTTRAQRALRLADSCADRVGNEYIGTQHLLIGLLEEKGIAAQLLQHLGVTADDVRAAWREQTGKSL